MNLTYERYRYRILKRVLCWHTDGFETFDLFQRHYKKHVIDQGEFGAISDWRYLRKADAIFGKKSCPANHHGSPNCKVENCIRGHDSAYLRYNNPKNELGVRQARFVTTYFRPLIPPLYGRAFFLAECLR